MVGQDTTDSGRGSIELVAAYAFDHGPFTATEAMGATGLTRATVLKTCEDLATTGWIRELDDARAAGDYRMGRPARRYELAEDAAFVVGLDVGQHRVAALVADLRGIVVARAELPIIGGDTDPELRLATAHAVVERATAAAGVAAGQVLVTAVGVPAPVDARGRSPRGDHDYWSRMNPGFAGALDEWGHIELENDANLAAAAERAHGTVARESIGVLLAGEHFGAGLIVDGVLLHGATGGAGELRVLGMVEGVGSSIGLEGALRRWVHEERQTGMIPPDSTLADIPTATLDLDAVVSAASAGDAYAWSLVDRLGERLGRVCAVLSSLLDVEEIVVAGGTAAAATPVVARAQSWLQEGSYAPTPIVRASQLGVDVVALGAITRAIATIRRQHARFAEAIVAPGRR
ncbi:ROK family protein [Plantibacter sp. RU18]|uniref:ROK family protein n=1 Tax=Plantibacter sp. RU18 TaxID=3158143 RepID=UPI003D360048